MFLSPATLLGSSLLFDRTGQTLLVVEPDVISVVEFGAGGQMTRLPSRDARAVAAFDDQVWVVTHDDQLVRIDHTGRARGPAYSLPFSAHPMLYPAPCGSVAAVWSSNPPLALLHDFGRLAATEFADVELALPFTGRRFVTVRGTKLTLPSGLVTMLPPNAWCLALGGAVMASGKAVTLLVTHAGAQQLVVVSLGTGQILQRCRIVRGRSGSRLAPASRLLSSSCGCFR